MLKKKINLLAFILLTASLLYPAIGALAQKITYTEPERDDTRRTNFEIIGKVGGNLLVFKGNRGDNAISVYDPADMKLKDRVKLDYMEERWINVDFIPYPDYALMIFQYQRKSIVYCMGVKLDGNGKALSDPVQLDTTRIGWSTNNRIYTTVFSDDKQKILIFKINNRNPKNFVFTTLLFNANLKLTVEKQQLDMPMEERNDYFTDFLVDNDGDMVFGKFYRRSGSDYISDISLVTKQADSARFSIHNLKTGEKVLDEVKLKVDNANKHYIFSSFYYKQRRGNIEGLYTLVWDKKTSSIAKELLIAFNDELRKEAKGPDANLRLAFNDYFITNIITRKDGGFILVSESLYSTSRGNAFNRWDYMYWNNPWVSPMDYYWSPYYSAWNSPWNRWGTTGAARYHAENIMILSFDPQGNPEWTNVIPKSQYDDESDALISHHVMNTGDALHFLFNQYERRTMILNDQSISPDGKLTRHPTLKNLERDIEFMPRYGKQISARSIIIPCRYRNYITFAKVDF